MAEVKLSIGGEDVGMNNSMEYKNDKGASMEFLGDQKDSSKEENIWICRRQRMTHAFEFGRTAEGPDSAEIKKAAQTLVEVIKGAKVEEFISAIEWLKWLVERIDRSSILNFRGQSGCSLLHVAVASSKDDILQLLLFDANDQLIATQNDWGDTPFHTAAKTGNSKAVEMLIRRARKPLNDKRENQILTMKNKHGNTALHEAVLNRHVNVVSLLLKEDLEPVYLENEAKKSPLYLALDTGNSEILEILLSYSPEPSKIKGLPPVHGALVRPDYDLLLYIYNKNQKLFEMKDDRGGNVFHLAAFLNEPRVFKLLPSRNSYLFQEGDENGDLPIHIASKMGHVLLIKKLYRESQSVNKRGQTVLHLAAKYGRASVVRYILRDSELGKLINERDYDGNTALHLAVMHSQLAALIPLVLDTRIDPRLLNHRDFTAFDIALDRIRKEYTFQKLLAFTLLRSVSPKSSADQIILKREARHEAFPVFFFIGLNEKLSDLNQLRDDVNTRLVVATLVTTVTFAAGFAVPGGFNSSDTASKDYRGMATMLDKRMFQSFAICNTIAMFCSMTSVVNLMLAHRSDAHLANAACWHATVSLSIALPAMSAAFLTGVILTVDKLPWLATTILILGYVFLLIITVGSLSQFFAPFIQCFPFFWRRLPPIRPLLSWFFLAPIFFLGGETRISDDSEEDKTASETSASRALDGGGKD